MNLEQAVEKLIKGEVISYPTEAVYGLGCDPFNEQAFQKLLQAKQRPFSKGVILVVANLEQAKELAEIMDAPWTNAVLSSWASSLHPTTWVLPAKPSVPNWITGDRDTVAIRLSHHCEVNALCEAFGGALVSTSANLSGEPPIKDAAMSRQVFPEISVLEGELSGQQTPSQIWDAQTMQQLR